jgi:hypothetical protein
MKRIMLVAILALVCGPAFSQANPPALTWAQVLSDNNVPPPPRLPRDVGIYPFGINGYSWELGGDEYLGDPTRIPLPIYSAMTGWAIIYQKAAVRHGAALPTVACQASMRKFQTWVHKKTGGWTLTQDIAVNPPMVAALTPNQAADAPTQPAINKNADGSCTWPCAGAGYINFGWPDARGSFAAGTVDGAFLYFELKVDQPNANLIATSGIDWWQTESSGPGTNTCHSQSIWKEIGTNWVSFTGSSVAEVVLRSDPPPPLVGIVSTNIPGAADNSTKYPVHASRKPIGEPAGVAPPQ